MPNRPDIAEPTDNPVPRNADPILLLYPALLVAVIALAATSARWLGGYWRGIDDANIFFSYARNLASGNGLTYGANHTLVEGFTSPLWMLLCSGSFWLGLEEWGVHALTVVLFSLTVAVSVRVYLLGTGEPRNVPVMVAVGGLLLSAPAFVMWNTVVLMDTTFWTLSLVGFAYVVATSQGKVGMPQVLMCAITLWTRPEAMLVVPVFTALYLWCCSRSLVKDLLGFALPMAAVYVLALALLIGIRYSIFGELLPNTYYAKFNPELMSRLREGVVYARGFLQQNLFYAAAAVLQVGYLLKRGIPGVSPFPERGGIKEYVSAAGLTLLLPPIWNGGDHFALYRLCQPAVPFLVLTVCWACHDTCVRVRPRCSRAGLSVGLAVIGGILLFQGYALTWMGSRWMRPALAIEFRVAEESREQGDVLGQGFAKASRYPVVGVVIAGGVSLTYPGPIIDLMGLNHAEIAHATHQREGVKNHAAFQPAYLDRFEVEVLPVDPASPFMRVVLKGCFLTPDFAEAWVFGRFDESVLSGRTGKPVEFFVRKDFLEAQGGSEALQFQITRAYDQGEWREIADAQMP